MLGTRKLGMKMPATERPPPANRASGGFGQFGLFRLQRCALRIDSDCARLRIGAGAIGIVLRRWEQARDAVRAADGNVRAAPALDDA